MFSGELTEDNFYIFAAKNYYNPLGVDAEEFEEDLQRFKYVKRLVNRYLNGGELPVRLILNHMIVLFNVFGIKATLRMLEIKMEEIHRPVIKPFLIFLKAIEASDDQYLGVQQDWLVVEELRRI